MVVCINNYLFFSIQLDPLLEVSIPHRSTTAPVSSALMSPQQFAKRERQSDVKQESLVGLTKEQLQQSLIYMIQVCVCVCACVTEEHVRMCSVNWHQRGRLHVQVANNIIPTSSPA